MSDDLRRAIRQFDLSPNDADSLIGPVVLRTPRRWPGLSAEYLEGLRQLGMAEDDVAAIDTRVRSAR